MTIHWHESDEELPKKSRFHEALGYRFADFVRLAKQEVREKERWKPKNRISGLLNDLPEEEK
jgi:hypothetical protein